MMFFSPDDPENETLMLKLALVFVIPVAAILVAALYVRGMR